jgi:hypothetical protein
MMSAGTLLLSAQVSIGQTPPASQPFWRFDPNALTLAGGEVTAKLRPVGDMHGVVIEKLADAVPPTDPGRAFLNLEHYLQKGQWAEYLPRRLDHTATLNANRVSIEFPQPKDWPVVGKLTYTWTEPNAIDARLDFTFSGELTQFEVYFTSYVAPAYERRINTKDGWVSPEISEREQLLIARDDKIAARYKDGRWGFLGDRTRLADERFALPVMISTDAKTGWSVVQMVEPGTCTHIAPNRFAHGHNFIIGGWDVKPGDTRSACIRLLLAKDLNVEAVEQAQQAFADRCRQERASESR